MRESLYDAEKAAQSLAGIVDRHLPKGWSFFLCLASNGDDGFATYVSNIERDSAGAMMLEILDRWKADPETWANVTAEYEKAKERNHAAD